MLPINAYVIISILAVLVGVLTIKFRNRITTRSPDVTQRLCQSWLVIGILCFAAPCGHATTVVVFWTDSWIVLATDSLSIGANKRITACKIDEAKDVVIVMDGLTSNSILNFNARSIAKETMVGSGSIEQRYDTFAKRIGADLPKVVERSRQYNPEEYKTWIGREDYILGVVFAAVENEHPKIIIVRFWLNPNSDVTPERVDTNKVRPYVAAYGECIRTECAIQQAREHGPVIAADKVINAGIAIDPDSSGPPVSIVRVDAKGVNWLQPGLCKATGK